MCYTGVEVLQGTAAISNVGGCFTILPQSKVGRPNQEWTNEGYLVQVGTSWQEQDRNFTAKCMQAGGHRKAETIMVYGLQLSSG